MGVLVTVVSSKTPDCLKADAAPNLAARLVSPRNLSPRSSDWQCSSSNTDRQLALVCLPRSMHH